MVMSRAGSPLDGSRLGYSAAATPASMVAMYAHELRNAAFSFARRSKPHIKRPVDYKSDQGKNRNTTGVPVEDAGVGANPEVRPQWLKEKMIHSQRDAAHHVAERCAEEDRQQRAGYRKESVEQ